MGNPQPLDWGPLCCPFLENPQECGKHIHETAFRAQRDERGKYETRRRSRHQLHTKPICAVPCVLCSGDYRFSALVCWICYNSIPPAHFHLAHLPLSTHHCLAGLEAQQLVPFNRHKLICCSFDEDYWGLTWQSMHCHCPKTRVLLPERNL